MTSITLPNLTFVFALLVSGAMISNPAHASSSSAKMRVDCRFYSGSHFCYSSAMYRVDGYGEIDHIRFGAGCDYETLYDDSAISSPQDEVSDSIRPPTAAIPRVEITPKGALRHPGTYTSKLESDHGRFNDGTCYVREVGEDEGGDDYHMLTQDWFYFQ